MALHQQVLREKGKVLFAKIGKSIGAARLASLQDQIKDKGSAKIILVGGRSKNGRPVFEASVVGAGAVAREELKRKYMPAYYMELQVDRAAGCWFIINSIKKRPTLREGEFLTSGSRGDLVYALDHSMAGYFIVEAA